MRILRLVVLLAVGLRMSGLRGGGMGHVRSQYLAAILHGMCSYRGQAGQRTPPEPVGDYRESALPANGPVDGGLGFPSYRDGEAPLDRRPQAREHLLRQPPRPAPCGRGGYIRGAVNRAGPLLCL